MSKRLNQVAITTREGHVVMCTVADKSKSERPAIQLESPDGERVVLRKKGGPAFSDPALEELIGKYITGTGTLTQNGTFIMESWEIKPALPASAPGSTAPKTPTP